MPPVTFVLNDETKTNSHGFRTRNAGIDRTRFTENPVLLDFHNPSNKAVIGRWENIRIEGSLLLADAVFDSEDPDAKIIEGKVERGFIKGASMGLGMMNATWELIDDVPTVTLCELVEASVVSIPSNANALKLYNSEGEALTEDDIKLSIESISNQFKNPIMKQIQLSVATLLVLGLQADQLKDNAATEAAIEKLAKDFKDNEVKLTAVTTERDDLRSKLTAIDDAKATTLVEDAVKTGKIPADKKDHFLSLAKSDFATCEGILSAIPVKKDLAATVVSHPGTPGAFDNVKTMDEFEKLSADQKLAFKSENPEQYKQIFSV